MPLRRDYSAIYAVAAQSSVMSAPMKCLLLERLASDDFLKERQDISSHYSAAGER